MSRSFLVFRLLPGDDLYESLVAKASESPEGFRSFAIVTCVGSLKQCKVRLAGATASNQATKIIPGPLEIVSLIGTIAHDKAHIHISVSDKEGLTHGGHLMSGSTIDTTAEVVLANIESLAGVTLTREMDHQTGFKELCVNPLPTTK